MQDRDIMDVGQDLRREWKHTPDDQAVLDKQSNIDYALREHEWEDLVDYEDHSKDEGHVSFYLKHVESVTRDWERLNNVDAVIAERDLAVTDIPWTDEYGYSWVPVDADIGSDVPEYCEHDSWGRSLRKLHKARRVWMEELAETEPFSEEEQALNGRVRRIEHRIALLQPDSRALYY